MSFSQSIVKPFETLVRFYQDKSFHPFVFDKKADNRTFKFLVGDLDGKEWYFDSSSTDDLNAEMQFLKDKVVTPGDVIIECGTHHGWTTLLLGHWTGNSGKVIGFEINPKNAAVAQRNFELNNCENILLECKGTGSEDGSVSMFRKSNASVVPKSKLSLGYLKNSIYGQETVEAVSLDGYAKRNNVRPDIFKLDVEGYEAEVLKGSFSILQACPKLAIEIHTEVLSRHKTCVKEIFDLVDVSRYHCWIQWSDDERPEKYYFDREINHRVHLFALPKTENSAN